MSKQDLIRQTGEVPCRHRGPEDWECERPAGHVGPHMASKPYFDIKTSEVSWNGTSTTLDEEFERSIEHKNFRDHVCSWLGMNQAQIDSVSDHEIYEEIGRLRTLEQRIAGIYKQWAEKVGERS